MTVDNKDLFPSENETPYSGGLPAAIVKHIEDGIEDGKSLRGWRAWIAGGLLFVAACFYAVLLRLGYLLVYCEDVALLAKTAPTVLIALMVILAAIPTLITISVGRAIFSKRAGSDAYTPLQAIIHLMKEMKEG